MWPPITIGISLRECLQSYKAAYDAITLVPSDVNSDSGRSIALRFSAMDINSPNDPFMSRPYSATVFQAGPRLYSYLTGFFSKCFICCLVRRLGTYNNLTTM